MRKILSIALCICICALSLPYISLAAGIFSDVPESYWGLAGIESAASSGLIAGYELADGRFEFRPERAVSIQESLTMLWNTQKAAGLPAATEDFSEAHAAALDAAQVASWARKFVACGLEAGYASVESLGGASTKGAASDASRAKIAGWASALMDCRPSPLAVLRYADSAKIATRDAFAVDALYRYNIMRGDGNRRFNAADAVRRVEMAVVCTKILIFFQSKVQFGESITKENSVVSISGTLNLVDAKNHRMALSLSESESLELVISPDARIFLEGVEADVSELAKIKGKFCNFAAIAGDNKVLIESVVRIRSGRLVDIFQMEDFELVEIDKEGESFFFCIDDASRVEGVLSAGMDVKFIADGAHILEIKVF
ncbi:MAG: S-layer homology domain-containing protein [Clostridiales bacterium]|nr:S-layer homology domain-containing protein [Clostridiales bacterium]